MLPTANLTDDLKADARSLRLWARKNVAEGEHLLLVVDQFEELFTLCRDVEERGAFIDNLLTAAGTLSHSEGEGRSGGERPITIVVTLRADFYHLCAQHEGLREALECHQAYIGPMDPQELRRAIEAPAKESGWEFEPGLAGLFLADVGADGATLPEPGALPLLSHALLETWRRRRGSTLTLGGYAEAGGVRGAIARTAERVYQGMDATGQVITRRIFLRLTELGEGTQDTRRRAALEELFSSAEERPEVESVLRTLADARLVTTRKESVDVALEALIREWPTLREWLEQDREGLRVHRHLTEAALEWERLEREPGELYRGARLTQAREWAQVDEAEMSAGEREFLTASQEALESAEGEEEAVRQRELEQANRLADEQRKRADEQERAAQRMRTRNRIITIIGILAIAVATVAAFFWYEAQQQTRIARAGELSALAITQLDPQLALGLLLAVEAFKIVDTPQTRQALLSARQHDPSLAWFLRGHTDRVFSVAWSGDGRLASASADNTVIVWDPSISLGADLESRQPTQTLRGHLDWVNGVAWSGDGRLASASRDNTVIVWDLESGLPAQTLQGHTDWVNGVAWSGDGRLASASMDDTVIVWDLESGLPAQTLEGHTSWVNGVAWSGDGRLASASKDKTIIVWDLDSVLPCQSLHGHTLTVESVAWSGEGRLASASTDITIIIWDLDSGLHVQSLQGYTRSVESVAWSRDGRLTSASLDNTVIMWDLKSGQPVQSLHRHTHGVASMSWSGDGRLASASGDNTVIVWDLENGLPAQTLQGHTDWVNGVAWSGDGRLASASRDDTVIVWDLESGLPAQTLEGHTSWVNGVAWSGDGRLASASADNTVIVWDLVSGQSTQILQGHTRWIQSVAWSADGRLASASSDDTVILWDLESGQPAQTLQGHTDQVLSIAWSGESRLASASEDNTVIVWDLESGQPAQTLQGHTDQVLSIAWSGESRLASASEDNTIIVWDLESGQPAQTLRRHTDVVTDVAWSWDGRLASASLDNTVIVWETRPEVLIAQNCSRALRNLTQEEWTQYIAWREYERTCPQWPGGKGIRSLRPLGWIKDNLLNKKIIADNIKPSNISMAFLFGTLLGRLRAKLRKTLKEVQNVSTLEEECNEKEYHDRDGHRLSHAYRMCHRTP